VLPYFIFRLLDSFFMIAGIGFLAMNRAKTWKDETDTSERPTAVLGVVCIIIAVILDGVYLASY
jgi:hypothetical protein